MIEIKRKRYVIVHNDEIWCGLARDFHFKSIANVGNTAIKTYRTEKQAWDAVSKTFARHYAEEIKVVPVWETISEREE